MNNITAWLSKYRRKEIFWKTKHRYEDISYRNRLEVVETIHLAASLITLMNHRIERNVGSFLCNEGFMRTEML
jgi:hypothetical protein